MSLKDCILTDFFGSNTLLHLRGLGQTAASTQDMSEVSALSADKTRVFLITSDVSKVSALSGTRPGCSSSPTTCPRCPPSPWRRPGCSSSLATCPRCSPSPWTWPGCSSSPASCPRYPPSQRIPPVRSSSPAAYPRTLRTCSYVSKVSLHLQLRVQGLLAPAVTRPRLLYTGCCVQGFLATVRHV